MGHQKKTLIKKSTATAMAVLLSISLGVSAVAYWSATGTGTGTAQTTSGDTSVVITQTSVINDLEPGKTLPDNIVGTLSPPPDGTSIFIGTVTPSVTGTSNPACGPENFVTQPSVVNTEVSSTVTGVSLGTVVFNDSMSVNQNICKGVTVYLSYTSSAWRGVGAPSQPTNLIGTAGNGEVGLSWTSPSSTGGTTITGYFIQYSTDGGNWTTVTSSTGSTSTTYSVTGLTNGTPYWFRVAAVGTLSGATLTGNLATTTAAVTPYTTPSAPTALAGTKGNGKVDLTWTAGSNGGSVITGYRVQYSTDGSNWTTKTANTGSSLASYSVTGLTNGTPYYFQVSAINAAGSGPPTYIGTTPAPGDTVTPYTNPDAPTDFTATPSNGAASLSWTAPTNTGGKAITAYEVQRSTDGTTWTTLSSAITGTTYSATGLTNGTPYYFQVAALNDSTSISEWASTTTTPFTAPSTPTDLTATPSDGQVVLNWTSAPNGGKAIMGYQVQYTATPGDSSSWTTAIANTNTTATTYTVTGLTNGAPGYSFRIAAINNATTDGVGAMSSWTSAVTSTPYAVPDAASDVQGATSSGNIALTWNAPSNTGGLPITGYQIQISTDGTTWNNDVANTNSADNTPVPTNYIVTTDNTGAALSGTQGYYFRVLTITGSGTTPTGAVSAPSLASPKLYAQSVPDAPSSLAVVPGDSSAQLSWSAPANDGGNAITGYSVSYSPDGSTWTTATANNTLSSSGPVPTTYTVTGLTNGTAYYFEVAALNGLGSSTATATTGTYTPAKPTAAITAPANASVSSTWDGIVSGTATANAGTTLTGINLYIQKDGGNYWNGTTWVSGATSVAPTGTTTWSYTLPSGAFDGSAHTYNFSAVATNNASANSAAATSTYTLYPTAPAATVSYPTAGTTYGPDWTGSIAGTATLYEPASLVTLSTVNVTVKDTTSSQYWNGSSWQTGATTVPASIASGTDQTSGGNYADTLYNWSYSMPGADFTSQSHDNFSVTAAATDSVGNSITTPSTAFGYYYSAPTAVTGVTSTVGNGQVVLNWTTPTDNGNASITGYQVQDSTDGTTWTTVAANTASTSPTYTATGLTNGTTYYFRVAAINTVGAGAASYVGSASSPGNPSTPFTVPGAPSITTGTVGNAQITLTWNAPSSNGGANITGYQVQTSTDGSNWTTAVANTGSTGTSYTVTGLTNGTAYYFQVAAINHTVSDLGSFSSSYGPVTPYTTTDAPTSLSGAAGQNGQVPLSWTAPASNGGSAITGYSVDYSTNGTSWTSATTNTGSTTTSYTVTGLTNGTSYYFRVAAINTAGTGAYEYVTNTTTSPGTTTIPYTTPGTPTGVTGASSLNAYVSLTWSSPSSNGNAISGYAVQYSSDGGSTWTSATTNSGSASARYNVTGLTNGTSYVFQVAAINAAGQGSWSASSAAYTPATNPTAPIIAGASGSLGRGAGVAYDSSGNAYVADYGSSRVVKITPGGTQTTVFTVSSPVGIAVDSSGNIYVTSGLNVIEYSTGGTQSTLWTATGANPIGVAVDSSGNVYVADNSNGLFEIPAGGGTATSIGTGLASPHAVALDSSGNVYVADYSKGLLRITGGTTTTIDALSGLLADGIAVDSSGNVYVSTYNDHAIRKYINSSGVLGSPSIVAAGLYQNPAINGIAINPTNNDLIATSGNSTVLLDLTAGANQALPVIGNGQVTVSWTAPASSGGPAISSYTAHAGISTCTTSTTSCTITGLTNGSSYNVYVTATNGGGLTSPATSYTASVIPAAAPSAPQSLVATGTDSSATLAWTAPSTSNGASSSSYQVQYSTDGSVWNTFTPATPLSGTTATTSVTGLSNGTSYYFRVAAINTAGTGAYEYATSNTSSPGTATLVGTVPSAPTLTGIFGQVSGSATSMTFDSSGNAYVVSSVAGTVTKITPSGTATVLGFTGLSSPAGVAVDSSGNVYVADYGNNRIEELSTAGVQSQYMSFYLPMAIAIDPSGNVYIGNAANGYIAEYTSAGSPIGTWGTGLAVPYGIALDSSGNLYVSDTNNNRVVEITPSNVQTTIGPNFSAPAGIAVDSSGNVYEGDTNNHVVTKIAPNGNTTIVSTGFMTGGAVGVDPSNNVYVGNLNGMILNATTNASKFTGKDGSITFTWAAPASNGGSAVTGYTVTDGAGHSCSTAGATTCTITGLTPGLYPAFTVSASNVFGSSATTTLPRMATFTAPNAPTGFSVANGSTQVTLTWSTSANTNSYVTNYVAQYSTDGSTWSTFATLGKSATTSTITGLTNGTPYYFRVGAVSPYGFTYTYNGSNPGTSVTPNGALVTSPTNNSTVGAVVFGIGGTATPSTGSTINTIYVAIKDSNNGKYWNGTAWQTGFTVVAASGTTKWSYNGISYSNLTNSHVYNIAASMTDASGANLSGPVTTFTYSTATNPGAVGSPIAGWTYGANIPSAATGTMPSGTSPVGLSLYDTNAQEYWNGSAWAPGLQWFGTPTTLSSTTWSVPLPVTNMTSGHSYLLGFININALGNFGSSPGVTFIYSTLLPTATVTSQQNHIYSTADWSGSPTITGTAAATAPGSSVAGVKLAIQDSVSGNYWNGSTWNATSTAVSVTTGTTNWSYTMPVSAFAASGYTYGDNVNISPVVTDWAGNTATITNAGTFTVGQIPGAVSSFSVTQTGALSNTVTYGTAPSGTGTTLYTLQYSINGGATWSSLGSGTSPYAMNDAYGCFFVCNYNYANPGAAVYYSVTPNNQYGNGPTTYFGGGASPGTSVPFINTPASMTGGISTTAQNGAVALNWTSSAPTPTAASPLNSYTVKYSTDGTTWTTDTSDCTATATTCTVTNLTNGTPYYFQVTPNNNAGSGGSAYVGSTTTPGSTVTPYTLPSAVAGSGITASSTLSGSEKLTWSAPSNNGSAITGYAVQYSTDGTNWTTATSNTGSTTTSYTVTGLTATTAYYFRVAAINAAGTGSYGATTSTYYPAAPTTAVTSPTTAVGPSWNGTLSGTTSLGRAGTTISGVNVSVNGLNVSESGAATLGSNSWTYTVNSADLTQITQTTSGNYTVTVTVTDSAGNTGTTTYTLVANHTSITSTISSPVSGTTYTHSSSTTGTVWPNSPSISGTATVGVSGDSTNSLTSLNIAILDTTSSQAWNGTSWVGFSGNNYSTVSATIGSGTSGVYNWTYAMAEGNLTTGHSYVVKTVSGLDARGNVLPNQASTTFSYLYTTPGAPSAAPTVTATGTSGQLSASWNATTDGGGTVSGYQIQVSTDGTTYYIANNNTGSTSLTANISTYCTTWSGGTPGSGTCTASKPLSDSTAYYVEVAGINQLGAGSLSSASSSVTPTYVISGSSYILAAGGGGGGGTYYNSSNSQYYKGGGGGAGGVSAGSWSPTAGYAFNITVGTGGAGGSAGPNVGSNGGNSTLFFATTTGGGGGGGGFFINAPASQSGAAGGSGGGAGHGPTAGVTGGAGTAYQGFNGGGGSNSATYYSGGGGGGWQGIGTTAGSGSLTAGGPGGYWSATTTSTGTCTSGAAGTATACYGIGGTGNSGTATPTTPAAGGSSQAGSGSASKPGEAGSNGVVGIFIPSAYLGANGAASFSAGCTTSSLSVSSPAAGTAYFVTATSGSCTFTYNPTAGSTTISSPGAGALGSITSFSGALSGSTTASNGSVIPSTTNAITLTIKDTTANSGAGAWWNGSSWQSTATTVTTAATSSGSATSTWTYAIAAANFTSGNAYNITAMGTDSGGTISTSTATTFTASGF